MTGMDLMGAIEPLYSHLPQEPEAGYNRGLYVDNLPRESLSSRWQYTSTKEGCCQEATVEAGEQVRALLPQKRFYGITKLVVIWLTLIV